MNTKKIRRHRNQRGVALLLALGSLSLMLVTGMAFLSNAIIARQAAANYRGRAQAKYIARSAVARLMMRIKYNLNNADSPWDEKLDMIVSRHVTGDGSKMQSESAVVDRITDDEKFMRSYVNGERKTVANLYGAGDTPQWEFLYDLYEDGDVSDDAKIIGRIAYMAIPGTANVNLSEVLRGHPDAVAASNSETGWEKRRGVGIRELNFGAGFFSGSQNALSDLAQRFATGEDYAGDQSKNYSFRDYQSFDELSTALGRATVNRFREYMLTSGYNDPEVFATDGGADRSSPDFTDAADFYHRFWLNRKQADWNALTIDDLLGEPTEFLKEQLEQPASNTVKALPYLRKIWWQDEAAQYGSDSGYDSVEARRKQVAANLLDYADENDEPTSDSSNWWSNEPTYTGLEKTHYLNEIGVQFTTTVNCTLASQTTDPNTGVVTRNFEIDTMLYVGQVLLETVNIYNTDMPNQQFSIEGSVECEIQLPNGSTETQTIPFKQENLAYSPTANGRYARINFEPSDKGDVSTTTVTVQQVNSSPAQTQMKVALKKLTIDRMYLMDNNGNPVDYTAKLEQDFTELSKLQDKTFSVPLSDGSIIDRCLYAGFQVDDPRENLTQGYGDEEFLNWKATCKDELLEDTAIADPADYNGTTSYDMSFGRVNNFFLDLKGKYADQKIEQNISDAFDNISTAYIRNEIMETPLELGAIHRASKWQTINLKNAAEASSVYQYTDLRAGSDTQNGFTYEDGDGNILDQIKMTERVFAPGKINMNRYPESANNFLFQAAFEGIPWQINTTNTLEYYANAGKLSEAAANTIRNELSQDVATRGRFLSRGAMIGYPYGSGTTNRLYNAFGAITPENDMQAEAIPAMSAALFTANTIQPDTISFVLVAQAVTDIGGNFKMAQARVDDADATVERTVEYGKFDYEKVNDRYYYFDKIVGEVKMLVTIRYERESRKVTLINTEYID
ncbi:MAG: hypothetical protein IJC73_02195 [Lentisphaeria bacterium]|nr:hypothetical protein [Lentisphaeria bacterium]